ncbi:cupin domain-containing protein [Rubrobacter marinus]|uniref:Cupin domain-containing protein n=2 Tax=Rubrobacter marinus TaxID=2653852 RepID=A0A6G8Q2M8_9ACTN|nr:cupin domain-containing protein [Rubrobacter marinus]
MQGKSLDSPDEVRSFEKGRMDVVNLGGDVVAGRAVFEPGWRWSEHVKPVAGTDSCQVAHVGYVLSGRLHVRMDDGSEGELGPGDAMTIPPGHDAWTVGDEPCTMLDFSGAERYAREKTAATSGTREREQKGKVSFDKIKGPLFPA